MEDVELAPFRNLDDFLLESARFQVPTFNNPERWANRVLNNLLYYQTNYFMLTLAVFVLVGIMNPVSMIFGCAAVVAVFMLFAYVTDNNVQYKRFKRKHPTASVAVVFGGGYILVYFLGSILVFLYGIAMPLLLIILHASMRLRNVKNKLANKIEFVGIKRTPMGLILEALGQEQEAGS